MATTDHYDSTEEEAIDWYQHYMAIPAGELAAQYALKAHGDGTITTAMEMAMQKRSEEIAHKVVEGEL